MSLLKVSNLSARYGGFRALFDVDLHVEDGECVAVAGANGAGKSTLLGCIAGRIRSPRESIAFDGGAIGGVRAHEVARKGIALVPEGRRLFSSLSVEENLLIGAEASRRAGGSLDAVYRIFPRLRERRNQKSFLLSGGEQQMAAIGRSLMAAPRLLMCDELSLGLSPKLVDEVFEALADIRSQGVSMLIVEQNTARVSAFADRLYCLREGRVVLEGKPGEFSHEQISQAYFGD